MEYIRKYGHSPYKFIVIHGGPGATGSMAPVAQELSKYCGVLEPFQSKDSINGQINEFKKQIFLNSTLPVTLIGHSWGAWISFIFTANFPEIVKKLILINSGCFEDKYISQMTEKRKTLVSL